MTRPVVLAAHGTADRDGLAELERLRAAVAEVLSEHEVRLGFVDVAEPHVSGLLATRPNAIVVPVFVTAGFHVRVDLPEAIAEHAAAATMTTHLGALAGYVDALAARVGSHADDPIAVVVAGSSDDRARAEADALGVALAGLLRHEAVPVVHLSGPGPRPDSLDPLPRLIVSTLLAPGYFQTRLTTWAHGHGIAVTGPVGADPAVIATIVAEIRRVSSAPEGA